MLLSQFIDLNEKDETPELTEGKRLELLKIVDKISQDKSFKNKEQELISTYLSLSDYKKVFEVYNNAPETDNLENYYCKALLGQYYEENNPEKKAEIFNTIRDYFFLIYNENKYVLLENHMTCKVINLLNENLDIAFLKTIFLQLKSFNVNLAYLDLNTV